MKIVLWVPSFSRARRSFLLFLGRLLCRRARYCPSLFFSGWSSIFMFSSGRASMRWVGPKIASLRLAPVRAASCRRGLASCMSAELGGAHFLSSSSYMLVVPRANLHFQHGFPLFRRRLVSVCLCVCVSECKREKMLGCPSGAVTMTSCGTVGLSSAKSNSHRQQCQR